MNTDTATEAYWRYAKKKSVEWNRTLMTLIQQSEGCHDIECLDKESDNCICGAIHRAATNTPLCNLPFSSEAAPPKP